MRVAVDSSAMAKRHIQETGTEQVLRRLAEADEVVVSILVVPEIASALNRRRREGAISHAQYEAHMRDVREDIPGMRILELSEAVVRRAIACLERAPLRASDAIHVATALEAGVDRLVTADRRQIEAAKAMGLRVEPVGQARRRTR